MQQERAEWPIWAFLGVALLVASILALGGYKLGQSQVAGDSAASAAERAAFDVAFEDALDPGAKGGFKRGYAEGLRRGALAGRLAGLAAGREAKPAKTPAALVWAVGDGADGGDAGKRVAEMIGSTPLDRFLYLGDVYEGESLSEFQAKYGSTFGPLDGVAAPTPGNHEWPSHTEGYDPYWEAAKGRPQPPWYSFELGGWQFLSLNSQTALSPGSEQLRWLQETLANEPDFGTCRIGFWHRPLKSIGEHGPQADVAPLWNALRGNAAIVLNGHDHNMQRWAPSDGITEFVSGAGGHEHYGLHKVAGLEFGNDSDYGALRLKLKGQKASYAFVSSDGEELDSGSLSCKRG